LTKKRGKSFLALILTLLMIVNVPLSVLGATLAEDRVYENPGVMESVYGEELNEEKNLEPEEDTTGNVEILSDSYSLTVNALDENGEPIEDFTAYVFPGTSPFGGSFQSEPLGEASTSNGSAQVTIALPSLNGYVIRVISPQEGKGYYLSGYVPIKGDINSGDFNLEPLYSFITVTAQGINPVTVGPLTQDSSPMPGASLFLRIYEEFYPDPVNPLHPKACTPAAFTDDSGSAQIYITDTSKTIYATLYYPGGTGLGPSTGLLAQGTINGGSVSFMGDGSFSSDELALLTLSAWSTDGSEALHLETGITKDSGQWAEFYLKWSRNFGDYYNPQYIDLSVPITREILYVEPQGNFAPVGLINYKDQNSTWSVEFRSKLVSTSLSIGGSYPLELTAGDAVDFTFGGPLTTESRLDPPGNLVLNQSVKWYVFIQTDTNALTGALPLPELAGKSGPDGTTARVWDVKEYTSPESPLYHNTSYTIWQGDPVDGRVASGTNLGQDPRYYVSFTPEVGGTYYFDIEKNVGPAYSPQVFTGRESVTAAKPVNVSIVEPDGAAGGSGGPGSSLIDGIIHGAADYDRFSAVVKDGAGTPITNADVKLFFNGSQIFQGFTGADGKCELVLPDPGARGEMKLEAAYGSNTDSCYIYNTNSGTGIVLPLDGPGQRTDMRVEAFPVEEGKKSQRIQSVDVKSYNAGFALPPGEYVLVRRNPASYASKSIGGMSKTSTGYFLMHHVTVTEDQITPVNFNTQGKGEVQVPANMLVYAAPSNGNILTDQYCFGLYSFLSPSRLYLDPGVWDLGFRQVLSFDAYNKPIYGGFWSVRDVEITAESPYVFDTSVWTNQNSIQINPALSPDNTGDYQVISEIKDGSVIASGNKLFGQADEGKSYQIKWLFARDFPPGTEPISQWGYWLTPTVQSPGLGSYIDTEIPGRLVVPPVAQGGQPSTFLKDFFFMKTLEFRLFDETGLGLVPDQLPLGGDLKFKISLTDGLGSLVQPARIYPDTKVPDWDYSLGEELIPQWEILREGSPEPAASGEGWDINWTPRISGNYTIDISLDGGPEVSKMGLGSMEEPTVFKIAKNLQIQAKPVVDIISDGWENGTDGVVPADNLPHMISFRVTRDTGEPLLGTEIRDENGVILGTADNQGEARVSVIFSEPGGKKLRFHTPDGQTFTKYIYGIFLGQSVAEVQLSSQTGSLMEDFDLIFYRRGNEEIPISDQNIKEGVGEDIQWVIFEPAGNERIIVTAGDHYRPGSGSPAGEVESGVMPESYWLVHDIADSSETPMHTVTPLLLDVNQSTAVEVHAYFNNGSEQETLGSSSLYIAHEDQSSLSEFPFTRLNASGRAVIHLLTLDGIDIFTQREGDLGHYLFGKYDYLPSPGTVSDTIILGGNPEDTAEVAVNAAVPTDNGMDMVPFEIEVSLGERVFSFAQTAETPNAIYLTPGDYGFTGWLTVEDENNVPWRYAFQKGENLLGEAWTLEPGKGYPFIYGGHLQPLLTGLKDTYLVNETGSAWFALADGWGNFLKEVPTASSSITSWQVQEKDASGNWLPAGNGLTIQNTDGEIPSEITFNVNSPGDYSLGVNLNGGPYLEGIVPVKYLTGATEIKSLTGQVTSRGEQPLSGALITLVETGEGQRSNDSGEYTFSSLPDGEYQLVYSRPGYLRGMASASTSGAVTEQPLIYGDINADDSISVLDLALQAQRYGLKDNQHPMWLPEADANKDGIVDIYDLIAISKNWGSTYEGPKVSGIVIDEMQPVVAEPGTLMKLYGKGFSQLLGANKVQFRWPGGDWVDVTVTSAPGIAVDPDTGQVMKDSAGELVKFIQTAVPQGVPGTVEVRVMADQRFSRVLTMEVLAQEDPTPNDPGNETKQVFQVLSTTLGAMEPLAQIVQDMGFLPPEDTGVKLITTSDLLAGSDVEVPFVFDAGGALEPRSLIRITDQHNPNNTEVTMVKTIDRAAGVLTCDLINNYQTNALISMTSGIREMLDLLSSIQQTFDEVSDTLGGEASGSMMQMAGSGDLRAVLSRELSEADRVLSAQSMEQALNDLQIAQNKIDQFMQEYGSVTAQEFRAMSATDQAELLTDLNEIIDYLERALEVFDTISTVITAAQAIVLASILGGNTTAPAVALLLNEIQGIIDLIESILQLVLGMVKMAPTDVMDDSFKINIRGNMYSLDQDFGPPGSPIPWEGVLYTGLPLQMSGTISFINDGGETLGELYENIVSGGVTEIVTAAGTVHPSLSGIFSKVLVMGAFYLIESCAEMLDWNPFDLKLTDLPVKVRVKSSSPEAVSSPDSPGEYISLVANPDSSGVSQIFIEPHLPQVVEGPQGDRDGYIRAESIRHTRALENMEVPVVTDLYPKEGRLGTEITIRGRGLSRDSEVSQVRFAGSPVFGSPEIKGTNGYRQIVAEVDYTLTGPVKVQTLGRESLEENHIFRVLPPVLEEVADIVITGDNTTLMGKGFSRGEGLNNVVFTGEGAETNNMFDQTHERLIFKVPEVAESGYVKVVTMDELVSNSLPVEVRKLSRIRLSGFGRDGINPVFAESPGGSFHVAWVDRSPSGAMQLLYSYWLGGQERFSDPMVVTALEGNPSQPPEAAMSVVGVNDPILGYYERVYLAWTSQSEESGKTGLYLSVGKNGTFDEPHKFNTYGDVSQPIMAAAPNGTFAMAWVESSSDSTQGTIQSLKFTSGMVNHLGLNTFGSLDVDAGNRIGASDPDLKYSKNRFYLAWSAEENGFREIYMADADYSYPINSFSSPVRISKNVELGELEFGNRTIITNPGSIFPNVVSYIENGPVRPGGRRPSIWLNSHEGTGGEVIVKAAVTWENISPEIPQDTVSVEESGIYIPPYGDSPGRTVYRGKEDIFLSLTEFSSGTVPVFGEPENVSLTDEGHSYEPSVVMDDSGYLTVSWTERTGAWDEGGTWEEKSQVHWVHRDPNQDHFTYPSRILTSSGQNIQFYTDGPLFLTGVLERNEGEERSVWLYTTEDVEIQRPLSQPDLAPGMVLTPCTLAWAGNRLSADGTEILVGRDVYLAQGDGANAYNLTKRGSVLSPVFDNEPGEIWTGMAPSSGGQSISWSPDGKRLVYADKMGIYLTDYDGKYPVRLWADPVWKLEHPVWSPDGKSILVNGIHKYRSEQTNFLINLKPVYDDQGILLEPVLESVMGLSEIGTQTWKPDGTEALGCNDALLWKLQKDGDVEGLAWYFYNGWDGYGSYSPDGEKIACTWHAGSYGGQQTIMIFHTADMRRWSLTDVDQDWNNITKDPSALPAFDTTPVWSPDSSKVAFVTNKAKNEDPSSSPGTQEIAVIDYANIHDPSEGLTDLTPDEKADLRQWRQDHVIMLTNNAYADWNPIWRPDGKAIYYVSKRDSGFGIYMVTLPEDGEGPVETKICDIPYTVQGGPAFRPMDYAEAALAVKNALTFDQIKGENDAENNIISDLSLFTFSNDFVEVCAGISWTSSNPGVIGVDGTVTRPAAGSPDVPVILTAEVKIGPVVETATFNLIVKAETDINE